MKQPQYKSLAIFMICIGYIITGLMFIPFAIGAISSYSPGVLNSSTITQLSVIMFVLVLIPFTLAYTLWKRYKIGWYLTIIFACFTIFLYLITFASLKISLSTGVIISHSPIGPLGYVIAYGIVYLGTYLLAIILIILNISEIYFLTRKKTKEYFGISSKQI